MKPGEQETQLFTQVVQLTRAVESHQQAIEEITNKVLLLATNLNTVIFRMSVTERLMKDKLGITGDEIMAAGMAAIEEDKAQRTAELAAQGVAAASSTVEEVTDAAVAQIGLPAESNSLRTRLLHAIP